MTIHTVTKGQTLTSIAKANNTTVENLVKLNNIKDPNKIIVGQKLSLGEVRQQNPQPQAEQKPIMGLSIEHAEQPQDDGTDLWMLGGAAVAGGMIWEGSKYVADKTVPYVEAGIQKTKDAAVKAKGVVEAKAKTAMAKTKDMAHSANEAVKNKATTAKNNLSAKLKNVKERGASKLNSAKDAVKSAKNSATTGAKKAASATGKAVKTAGKAAGKAITKASPAIIKGASRFAVPAAALMGAYEVKEAYKEGGSKKAVKQAIKTGGGIAGGFAGAKVGAAVGSFAGPVGTVVGGLVGGVAGYMLGEKLFSL